MTHNNIRKCQVVVTSASGLIRKSYSCNSWFLVKEKIIDMTLAIDAFDSYDLHAIGRAISRHINPVASLARFLRVNFITRQRNAEERRNMHKTNDNNNIDTSNRKPESQNNASLFYIKTNEWQSVSSKLSQKPDAFVYIWLFRVNPSKYIHIIRFLFHSFAQRVIYI